MGLLASLRSSVCSHELALLPLDRFPWNLILGGTSMETRNGTSNFVRIGQKKNIGGFCTKTEVRVTVAGDINSPYTHSCAAFNMFTLLTHKMYCCLQTTTMVTRKRYNVTLYARCVSTMHLDNPTQCVRQFVPTDSTRNSFANTEMKMLLTPLNSDADAEY